MLIITRKKGESLMIGDDIEITISKIDDGSVKLGIQAPKSVSIFDSGSSLFVFRRRR